MKKILTILCLLVLSAGVANAQPMNAPHHIKAPAQHKIHPAPKPVPVIYQVPIQQTPVYSNYYNNSPYVTFSLGNVDVTVGI